MNWKEYIVSYPDVFAGKPTIKKTRLSVGFILDLYAEGWNEQKILESYPQMTARNLLTIFTYIAVSLKDKEFIALDTFDPA
ncbi:MAG: DUF433 domain-containing protein [Proteobacteria bacterium]|nr:DUF433 domain-containing protein [Pseudomonadota bacterium]